MLEKMRESSVPRQFIFAADVVPHLKVDHRHGVVFEQNYLQAIGKSVRREIQLRRANVQWMALAPPAKASASPAKPLAPLPA